MRFSRKLKSFFTYIERSIRYSWKFIKKFLEEWIDLITEVLHRFIIGFKSVNFVIYFTFVIIIIGGLGVFPNAYKYWLDDTDDNKLNLAKTLSTYFITLIATSAADLLINKEPNESEASKFRMPAFAFLVFGGISIFFIQYDLIKEITFDLAFTASIVALFFWWITNSKDKKYSNGNNKDKTGPIGGAVASTPKNIPDTTSFQSIAEMNEQFENQNLPKVNF